MIIKISSQWNIPDGSKVDIEFKDGTVIKNASIIDDSIDINIPYLNSEIASIKPMKVAIRMRIKPPKRRTPSQRLKARLYYRKNRAKIKLQRKKYIRKYRSVLKRRKLFQRYKPSWIKKRVKPKHKFVHKTPPKPKRPKFFVPKKRPRSHHS